MSIVVTGSVAFDYLMAFPGQFREHIIAEEIEHVSLSFLVDSMRIERGGCAPNIAYNLALLGERPLVMATVGKDFADYRTSLEQAGVDTSAMVTIEDEFTSSCFINTDTENNQIVSFYMGAMGKADQLSFHDLDRSTIDLAIIAPNAPAAMIKYARECQDLEIPYLYDPSQQIVWLSGPQLIEGMRGAHLVIGNEYEYGMIRNKTGLSEHQVLEMPNIAIVTRGQAGSDIHLAGQTITIPVVEPSPLAEPTGVGDAYRAGLMKGMLHGFSWETTGRLAALAATYVLEHHGTQNHKYTLAEFIARYRSIFGDSPEIETMAASISS